jgi:hypothetical protein
VGVAPCNAPITGDPNRGEDSVPTDGLPAPPVLPLHTSHWFGPSAIGRIFTAFSVDDVKTCEVRYVGTECGEGHLVRSYPRWENQRGQISGALGREMVREDAQPADDGAIFVKAADGSPPAPTFDRVVTYTIRPDPAAHHVRINRDDTPRSIREGLQRLHPRHNLAEMTIE